MTTRNCSWETLVSPSAAAKYKDRSSTKKRSDRKQDSKRGGSNGPRITGLSNLRDNSNPRKRASLLLASNSLIKRFQRTASVTACMIFMQAAFYTHSKAPECKLLFGALKSVKLMLWCSCSCWCWWLLITVDICSCNSEWLHHSVFMLQMSRPLSTLDR